MFFAHLELITVTEAGATFLSAVRNVYNVGLDSE